MCFYICFLYYHRLSGLKQLMFNISQFLWVRNADTAYDLINLESVSQPGWDLSQAPQVVGRIYVSVALGFMGSCFFKTSKENTQTHKHTQRNFSKISTTLCSRMHKAYHLSFKLLIINTASVPPTRKWRKLHKSMDMKKVGITKVILKSVQSWSASEII